MAKIGIRLADGQFYPIMNDNSAAKKRLILTTIEDNQASVQIDMYRSDQDREIYIASLIIENLALKPKGEPDIRLDLGIDDEGELSAFAKDEASGEHQALTVSLKSLSEEEKYEIPDFDFQEDEDFDFSTDDLPDINQESEADIFDQNTDELSADELPEVYDEDDIIPEETHDIKDEYAEKEKSFDSSGDTAKKRVSPFLVGILAALGTALVLLSAFFIYRCSSIKADQTVMVQKSIPDEISKPLPETTVLKAPENPVSQETLKAQEKTPSETESKTQAADKPKSETLPAATEKTGIWHKIKWGDTLWDISISYYRNPWLYKTIAKANKIKNPDLIISGTWIYIPPR